jgi:outer membrane protein assembly factor BamB
VVAFHPQSCIVVCTVHAPVNGGEGALTAFEVNSGKQLWSTHVEGESVGACLVSPDGSVLLVLEEGGDMLVYRMEDGAYVQRLPSVLSEPVQALAFDQDGSTLWLATEERLVAYQPPS